MVVGGTMVRRFNKNDYRAIAFSLISIYVLLATVVSMRAIEYARTVDGEQISVRILGVAKYLNPVVISSSFK